MADLTTGVAHNVTRVQMKGIILSHHLKVSGWKNCRPLPGRGEDCVPYFCPYTYVLALDWPFSLSLWLEENIHFQNRTIYKYYALRCKEMSSLLTPFLPSYKVEVRVLLYSITAVFAFVDGTVPSFPMFVQYQQTKCKHACEPSKPKQLIAIIMKNASLTSD